MWEDSNPHAKFWRRLIRQRAIMFMESREYLQTLRGKFEEAKRMQKRFGDVWEEYSTDIFKLIAEACGENWDAPPSQDEEKNAFEHRKKDPAVNQKEDDNVVAAREAGSRERQHQLQGIVEESKCLLEEEEGSRRIRHVCPQTQDEEAGPKEEEESKRQRQRQRQRSSRGGGGKERSADFYRRAGCT